MLSTLPFLVIFASGIWLRRAGRPRHVALLTLHKLTSLAEILLIGLTAHQLSAVAGIDTTPVGAAAASVALYVAATTAGGWLSVDRPPPPAISAIHIIAPPLSLLATGATLCLLISR